MNNESSIDNLEQYILSIGGKPIVDVDKLNRWDDNDIKYWVKEIGQAARWEGYYENKTTKERFIAINNLSEHILDVFKRKEERSLN